MRDRLRIGDWRVEPDLGKLSRGEEQIQLEPKVMDLLAYLAGHPGELLSKERLIQAVWPDTFVTDEVLSNAIWQLRKALGDDSKHPRYIETLPRRGYRLIAPVESEGASLHADESKIRAHTGEPQRHRWLLWLTVALVLMGAAVILAIWFPRTTPAPKGAPTLRAVPFTSYSGSEERPDFSPQGDRIAYQWIAKDEKNGNSDIYVKQVGLGEPLRLTSDPNPDMCPRWSPDGQRIAFVRWLPEKVAIIEVPALGGSERTLAELRTDVRLYDQGGLSDLSWSPDGKRLAVSFRPHGTLEARCHLLDVDSGQLETCTSPPKGTFGDYFGQLSPDGKTIAFFRRKGWGICDLYQQSLPKGPVQQLTFESFAGVDGLTWMPDGRQIVFAADDRLWRVAVPKGEPVPLTGTGENLAREYPAMSRKGSLLAYAQGTPIQRDIWRLANPLVDSGQAQAERIISSTRGDDNPQPSPDGTRIAFASNRTGSFEIFVCNSDGSGLRQVTHLKADSGSPTWSPDGRQICFDSFTQDAEIYVVNAEGGAPRRLTTHPAADVTPTWSRDGRSVYFSSNRSGRYEIWKTTVGGSEVSQVTQQGGFRSIESVDGTRLYYANGFPGQIMVMATGGGPETRILNKNLSFVQWDLSSAGIYFADERKVYFLDFKNGRTREVLTLNVPNPATLRVTLDGRWFLCSGSDPREGSDIVLVEDFR